MIYQGLTHLESDGSVSPRLAESIDVTSDGLTYTFRIKPSYWSDGTPLTAHDFEASWKRALEPTFPSSCVDILYPIKNAQAVKRGDLSPDALGVQAHNATTLVVTLETPAPYFLSLTSFATCFPTPGGEIKMELTRS
jgi:oligopeptide transport system substrate-binding protein